MNKNIAISCLVVIMLFATLKGSAQVINTTIPEFALSLFDKTRSQVEQNLKNMEFKVFSDQDKADFGYTKDDANNTTVSVGNYMISCKVIWSDGKQNAISVGGVNYSSYNAMISEYTKTDWEILENGYSYFICKKIVGNYIYLAQVDFISSNGRYMANATYKRVLNK